MIDLGLLWKQVMETRCLVIAVGALLGGISVGAAEATQPPKPFQIVAGPEFLNQEGCLFVSAKAEEVACLDHSLDMGFVESTLRFYRSSGDYQSTLAFTLYSGRSDFDAASVNKESLRKANAHLAKKGFTATGVPLSSTRFNAAVKVLGAAVIVTLQDKKRGRVDVRGMLPALESKRARLCCGWIPLGVTLFSDAKKAVLTFKQDCAWERLDVDKKDPCYDAEYCGDECNSWTPEQILVLDTP